MSKTLKDLHQRQHDLKSATVAVLDLADAEDRDLTADEESTVSQNEADLKTVATEIEAAEKNAERRRGLEAIRTVPALASVTNEPNPATTGGFASLAEFASCVRNACLPAGGGIDQRLMAAPTNVMEGGGSAGEGFMLPVQFRDEIWQLVVGIDDILGMVDLEPTNARQIDGLADESTPWGSTGVQANWRAEGSQMSASKQATQGRSMTLHELYAFVNANDELLEDAPRLQNRLTVKAAQAINWKISDSLVYGTGAGQPLGWFESGALVSVAKETSQVADTINAANLLKMYSRLLIVPGDRPIWLANSDTLPALGTMTIGDLPAWIPNGVRDAPGGSLLGWPLRFSELGKTLGDKGDIQLVSPKGYYAARRTQAVQFASSMHLYFDYNMTAFRWTFRFGGQPHLSAPMTPPNSSNTKSHFVVLDERA